MTECPKLGVSFALLLLSVIVGRSQQVTLRGTVADSATTQVLGNATVTLLMLPGKDPIGTVKSNKEFHFSNLKKGDYILITSNEGFSTDSTLISIKERDSSVIVVHIILKIHQTELMQVIVHAFIPPGIVRSDTIAFNTLAFPTPPNSTVEDMLRKLPGIQIDKEGNITMQGQKVDKILIDGKEFFLNDLRTASQTLTADLVAEVEIFDTQSQRAKSLGIKESGTGKTINLKLKKNRPQGFFGKTYAGYGSAGSYSLGGDATKISGERMIFLSGNANNINSQFTGSEHENGAGQGIETSNNLQLNYRDALTDKLKATINAKRAYNNNSVIQQVTRQTATGDSSIIQTTQSAIQSKTTTYNVTGEFDYAVDSLTQIMLNCTYFHYQNLSHSPDTVSVQTEKTAGQYLSSLGRTNNTISTTSYTINNSLLFSHQFSKKGRRMYVSVSQFSSPQNQPAGLYSALRNFDSAGVVISHELVNQQSSQVTNDNGYTLSASWTEPVGKQQLLDFGYTITHATGYSDKLSFDFDSATIKYDLPDSLTTNRFLNHNTVQSINAGYNATVGRYSFELGVTGQLMELDNTNQLTKAFLRQQTTNWLPKASLFWDPGTGKNLFINYSEIILPPTTEQLQPVPDLSNPYLIKEGNPNLKPQQMQNISARYADFNEKTAVNWQAYIMADLSKNMVTSSSTVLPGGVQQVEYVNVQGVYHGSLHITYGFPLGHQKNGNASVGLHGNLGHDISLVNGLSNIAQSNGIGGSVSINFHARDFLFIDAGTDIDQTNTHYSLPGSAPAGTLNENFTLNINYRLPASVTITTYYDLQVTGSQGNVPSHAVSLVNAAIYKTIWKDHWEFRLSAYDLLNSASGFSQTTGVNYTQTQRTNLPGRILLCSVIYRFKKTQEVKMIPNEIQ
jgi:hypothetical protein